MHHAPEHPLFPHYGARQAIAANVKPNEPFRRLICGPPANTVVRGHSVLPSDAAPDRSPSEAKRSRFFDSAHNRAAPSGLRQPAGQRFCRNAQGPDSDATALPQSGAGC